MTQDEKLEKEAWLLKSDAHEKDRERVELGLSFERFQFKIGKCTWKREDLYIRD